MTRRRKRPNYFMWVVLLLVVLFGYYFNQVYLPTQPNPFEATPTPTRSWESFVTEAETLFKDGKLSQAIDSYTSAIKSSPQDPTIYIALARVQVFAGLPSDAQANAENAILLSNNNSMAHAVLAWALDFQDGKSSDALEEIEKAITLDPKNPIAHAYYVEILVDTGSIQKAIDESQVALGLDPNALETRRARAYLLSATGNYEESVQMYKSAIEVNPYLSMLHIELGKNLRIMQVYDQAIDEFIRANTLTPNDPEPDFLISRTYATIGEYEKALQYAETAVKDKPTEPRYRGNYGVMYYRNFFYTDALKQLGLAVNGGKTDDGFPIQGLPLSDDPRIAEYYFTYGLVLARTNQCGPALQISQNLHTKFPADDPANEVVLGAADSIIQICQENLDNPAVDTPVPTAEGTSTPAEATSTPEGTVTP